MLKEFRIGIKSRTEDRNYAKIFFQYGHNEELFLKIPNWLMPAHIEREYNNYGQKFYDRICPRSYYITTCDDSFLIYFGIQDKNGFGQSQCKVFDIPWKRMHLARWSLYHSDNSLAGHIYNDYSCFKSRAKWDFDKKDEIKSSVKPVLIEFKDYDGQDIIATCYIEERVWTHGSGIMCWLQYFKSDFIRRDVDISYNYEVGTQKNSWKGGIVGTSCKILPNESILSAFIKYGPQEKFTNIRLYTGDNYNDSSN